MNYPNTNIWIGWAEMGPKELNYAIFHHFLSNQTEAKLTWPHPPQHYDTYKKASKTRTAGGFRRPGCRYCCLRGTHSPPPPTAVALRALHAEPCGRTQREESERPEVGPRRPTGTTALAVALPLPPPSARQVPEKPHSRRHRRRLRPFSAGAPPSTINGEWAERKLEHGNGEWI